MVSANTLIYNFYLKKNAFNTGSGQDYKIKDVVALINEAWYILFENNVQRAETDRRYEDNIRDLKVINESIVITPNEFGFVAKYPKQMYKRLNQKVMISCADCSKDKLLPLRIVESDDINTVINNPYRQTNFGWEQIVAEKGPDGLYIYTDKQTKVDKVFIDYYRKPKGIQAPELVRCGHYVDELDNVITTQIDFETDSTYIARKVVDVAILISNSADKDAQQFQLDLNKITALEQVA